MQDRELDHKSSLKMSGLTGGADACEQRYSIGHGVAHELMHYLDTDAFEPAVRSMIKRTLSSARDSLILHRNGDRLCSGLRRHVEENAGDT